MRLLPKVYQRYVGRTVVLAVLAVWAVLLGFDLIQAFVTALGDVGQGNFGPLHAALATLLSMPRRIYALFPTAALIGCLLGLGRLAASSELTALRAAGLSRLRIALGVMLMLIALTGLMVIVGETLAPWGDERGQALATAAKSRDVIVSRFAGTWARDDRVFLNARSGMQRGGETTAGLELADVRIFEFGDDGKLARMITAASALHDADGWMLREARLVTFGADSVQVREQIAQMRWASKLDVQSLAASVVRPRYLPTLALGRVIDYMRANRLDARPFQSIYWSRWFYPLNVLALCLAAMPFAFGQLRSGGFGKRLFAGIVFGLGYFLLSRLTVSLADVYRFDVRLAYALPPLLVLGLAWLQFRPRRPA